MSFFDDLTKKAKVVANSAGEKAKDVADSARISAAILAEKREIEKNYRQIGRWIATEFHGEIPQEIADTVAAVHASQEKIAKLQASRESGSVQAADAAAEASDRFCPVCGEPVKSRFCPHCGAPVNE